MDTKGEKSNMDLKVFRDFERASLLAGDDEVFLQCLNKQKVGKRTFYSTKDYIENTQRVSAGVYSKVASWAYWDAPKNGDYLTIGNMFLNDMFGDERLQETAKFLNPNVVLLAANISRNVVEGDIPWLNFHLMPGDDDSHPNKTSVTGIFSRGSYRNSFLWGAYFTDFVKNIVGGRLEEILGWLKQSPEGLQRNFSIFRNEVKWLKRLDGTKTPVTIIVLGKDIYRLFAKNRGFIEELAQEIGCPVRFGWIGHYSGVRYYPAKQSSRRETLTRQVEMYCKQIQAMETIIQNNLGTSIGNVTCLNQINVTRAAAPDILHDSDLLKDMFLFKQS